VTRGTGPLLDGRKATLEAGGIPFEGPIFGIVPIVHSRVGFQIAFRISATATVVATAAVHEEEVSGVIIAGQGHAGGAAHESLPIDARASEFVVFVPHLIDGVALETLARATGGGATAKIKPLCEVGADQGVVDPAREFVEPVFQERVGVPGGAVGDHAILLVPSAPGSPDGGIDGRKFRQF
tara:strand:+ start:189 stop:734 length:546 start_codon:yes stop_codon:yes gene_type:complete